MTFFLIINNNNNNNNNANWCHCKQVAAESLKTQTANSRLRLRKAALTLTPAAVSRLKDLTQGPTPKYLRVGVRQKGCSGNSYTLEFTDTKGKFDEIVNQDGKVPHSF
ncbi:unnamed protein product [Rhizopus microsporus]